MLITEDLRIEYASRDGNVLAVRDVSVELRSGEFFTLLGPSGCGKTSTLRAVAGLERPTSGRIQIGAETVFSSARNINIPTHRRQIGMGFQSYAIWPHMTVIQNVSFPLRRGRGKMSRAASDRRARELLELVRLGHLAGRRATDLSGGQQQRVALARALVREPDLLLLDEPLSNLDAKLREDMRQEISDVVARLGITTLYVTHDQSEALSMSDRVAVMSEGDIVQVGSPSELYLFPEDEFVASFVGKNNVITGTVSRVLGDGTGPAEGLVEVEIDTGSGWGVVRGTARRSFATSDAVSVSFRPEAGQLTTDAPSPGQPVSSIDASVERVVFLGDSVEYLVTTPAGKYHVQSDPYARRFGEGEAVFLSVPVERGVVLARKGLALEDGLTTPQDLDPGDAVDDGPGEASELTGAHGGEVA